MAAFAELLRDAEMPPLMKSGVMEPRILKQYILLHDGRDGSLASLQRYAPRPTPRRPARLRQRAKRRCLLGCQEMPAPLCAPCVQCPGEATQHGVGVWD